MQNMDTHTSLDNVVYNMPVCPRCMGYHGNIVFMAFKLGGPQENKWTHWALCPTTWEPILYRTGYED